MYSFVMDDSTLPTAVPPKLREQFPLLIELILHSESMNGEERQYWIDILPIMTPEQITQLQGILQNEHDQLAAIDAKYADQIANNEKPAAIVQTTEERRQRHSQLSKKEESARSTEEVEAEELLKKME